MLADALRFPIISIYPKDSVFYLYSDREDQYFAWTHLSVVRSDSMLGSMFVDSAGTAYDVVGIKTLGAYGPFRGYRFPFDRNVRIDYNTGQLRKLSVVELAGVIINCLQTNRDMYEESVDVSARIISLREARTYDAVFRVASW